MLLRGYTLTIVSNHCLPGAQSVNGLAALDQDISEVIPYLNSALGGSQCTKSPPSVTFKTEGKLIAVQPAFITVNGIQDETQARKIIDWMIREINETWENRDIITPHFEPPERPSIAKLLRLLPKTNCRKCGEPTCMVFAVRLADGARDAAGCTELKEESLRDLETYLSRFRFED
jgi:ArsR family metal-binding transcriptional regulator